ncbi:MAG: class I SAM-dependent methyltransferase [Chitinophagaceae bacterium]|nr:MAG: class I SAM-dependent methyltransferase [Chitinophagaceae bacterium]
MSFERLEPGTREWQAYYANHIFRYQFAAEKIRENGCKKVLDAACGVGYGTYHLVDSGIERAIGVDRNASALAIAEKKYIHQNITFIQDDCETLSNANKAGPYDAVVSFETLEHLKNPGQFLSNCHSVLVPEGTLIVSTPNASVTSPDGTTNWQYHEKEYTMEELVHLLQKHGFKNIQIIGQAFSQIGHLKDDFRAELNRIRITNPVLCTGHRFEPVSAKLLADGVGNGPVGHRFVSLCLCNCYTPSHFPCQSENAP